MTEEWRTYVRLTCAATFASWIDMAIVRDEFYEWQNVWNQNIYLYSLLMRLWYLKYEELLFPSGRAQ